MTNTDFIKSIKVNVEKSTIDGLTSILENVPGRSPDKNLIKLSEWYISLPLNDKDYIHEVIKLTAKTSIFGMLCVLDGVRTIEETIDKGEIVLEFHKNGESIRLNDPKDEFLHDIFNSE